jgi:hypothetical protein
VASKLAEVIYPEAAGKKSKTAALGSDRRDGFPERA